MTPLPAFPARTTPYSFPQPTGAETVALEHGHSSAGTSKMSRSKVLDHNSCHSFRAFFAQRWKEFVRENYRNPEEVSVAFSVRFQTASNWWNGDNAPSGYAVAMAFRARPDSAAKHLTAGGPGE